MTDYKFVTREDVAEILRILEFETATGAELVNRLLAERDAYREVAAKYHAFYVVNKRGAYIPTLPEINLPKSKPTPRPRS